MSLSGQYATQKYYFVKMKFCSTTAARSFTSRYTPEGAVFKYSSNTSHLYPNSSYSISTALVASAHPQMSAEGVSTPTCLLNLTGDT